MRKASRWQTERYCSPVSQSERRSEARANLLLDCNYPAGSRDVLPFASLIGCLGAHSVRSLPSYAETTNRYVNGKGRGCGNWLSEYHPLFNLRNSLQGSTLFSSHKTRNGQPRTTRTAAPHAARGNATAYRGASGALLEHHR